MELFATQTLCSGCGICRLACSMENFKQVTPSKGLLRIEARFPAPGDYQVHLCDQCGECAKACPVEAITLVQGFGHKPPAANKFLTHFFIQGLFDCLLCAQVHAQHRAGISIYHDVSPAIAV